MFKQIILFLLLSTTAIAQSDSLLQKDLSISVASQVIPSSGIPYSIYQTECSLKKQDWVVIPTILFKKMHGFTGYQGGIDLYKKWNKGYGHTSIYYSPQNIFPKLIFKGNIFQNLRKNVEMQIGLNAIYFTDKDLYSINSGLSYYRKKIMINYSFQYYLETTDAHRFLIRKYLRKAQDFIQFAYFYGLQSDSFNNELNQSNVHTFQFGLHKTIFQKTQIQFSVATLAVYKTDRKEQYFTYRIALKRRF